MILRPKLLILIKPLRLTEETKQRWIEAMRHIEEIKRKTKTEVVIITGRKAAHGKHTNNFKLFSGTLATCLCLCLPSGIVSSAAVSCSFGYLKSTVKFRTFCSALYGDDVGQYSLITL